MPFRPELPKAALVGLVGRIVEELEPHTEADPAALLATALCSFGSAVGPGPAARADGASHPARFYVAVVGETAKARKGTSWNRIKEIMRAADPTWAEKVMGGLSSGEGLVKAAAGRDEDKRLMVVEPEFSRLLRGAAREGNVLSQIAREAWDGGTLRVMTKEPIEAKDAYVSLLAHITVEELRATMSGIEAANGFGNRFLFLFARRSRLLPAGGNLDDRVVRELGDSVSKVIKRARCVGFLHRSPEAEARWAAIYRELAEDLPGGLVGSLIARSESHVLRLSVVYALAAGSSTIELSHLEAALAFWHYCRESTAFIFGDRMGDPDAERVLEVLRSSGGVLAKNQLGRALGRSFTSARLDMALAKLEDRGLVNAVRTPTDGRTATLVVAVSL